MQGGFVAPLYENGFGVPIVAQWLTNLTRNDEVSGLIPGLAQWVKDPALLWLWRRPVATAPIQPLAWEPPYAAGAAQEVATTTTKDKKTKNKKQQQQKKIVQEFPSWPRV